MRKTNWEKIYTVFLRINDVGSLKFVCTHGGGGALWAYSWHVCNVYFYKTFLGFTFGVWDWYFDFHKVNDIKYYLKIY